VSDLPGAVPSVPSVRGELPVDRLGTTLMHEHVFVLTPDSQRNWGGWDEDAQLANAVQRLRELSAAGVRSIADPTVDGLGRDVARVARVNAEVPELNILVATGIYTYTDVPNYFRSRGPGALAGLPEPMVELFVRDLTEGIQGTGIRAAFLKCAIDHAGLTPGVERVLRAVGGAHRATGAPVMVHTHPARRTGSEAARVLVEEGVEPQRVLLAHSGDTADVDYLCELADAGYLLGMDRFGLGQILGLEERIATVAQMCHRGYAGRMVLAQDASCYIDWVDPDLLEFLPDWNYLTVTSKVVPALLDRGVAADQVEEMLVEAPKRWFAAAAGPGV
jgi:phosphotriesterase-related protein